MTPISPPWLSPCAEALSRKFGRRISNRPEQAQAEDQEQAGHAEVEPGVVGQLRERRRAEEDREEQPDRHEDRDDRQAIGDRQAGRRALLLLPLLDEEVDRHRDHRPDAGHRQGEQPAPGAERAGRTGDPSSGPCLAASPRPGLGGRLAWLTSGAGREGSAGPRLRRPVDAAAGRRQGGAGAAAAPASTSIRPAGRVGQSAAAIRVGADHEIDLDPDRLLAGRRPGRDFEGQGPGDLVLVEIRGTRGP